MKEQAAPLYSAEFGNIMLKDNRLTQGSSWSDISGATAEWWCEQSNKGPDVGRAILGIIGGLILGAIFGFLIIGGVFAMLAFAIVIGIVSGLKPVEHGKAHVVVTYPDGRRADIVGSLDDWQRAQYMAGQIIQAGAHFASTDAS